MVNPINCLEKYKEAENFALLALKKSETCRSEFIKAGIFHALAGNYFDMGTYPLANRFVDSAIVYYSTIQDKQQSGLSFLIKGKTLAKLQQYKEAEKWLNEGLVLVEPQKNWRNLKAAYQTQAIVATQLKQYDKALKCYEKYIEALNSSHNEEVTAQLTEMETRFETQKKQSQITQLEKETQIQSLTIQQQNTWLFASVAGLTLAILLGFYVYRNSRQKQKIHLGEIENLRKEKQLDALSGIIKGEENERNRMAQDLHDGLGSLLSGVKLSLTSMKGGAFISETQTHLFGHSLDQLDNAISEMRRVAHNLMPSVLAESGLVPALQQLTESLNESGSIQVHFEHYNFVDRLSKEQEIVAYRMVQEAVNNAIRHSGGSQIILQISKMDNQIQIEIEYNGKGFDPASVPASKTGGLKNLQNRAQYLNGTIAFQSSDHGTTVHIQFPV